MGEISEGDQIRVCRNCDIFDRRPTWIRLAAMIATLNSHIQNRHQCNPMDEALEHAPGGHEQLAV